MRQQRETISNIEETLDKVTDEALEPIQQTDLNLYQLVDIMKNLTRLNMQKLDSVERCMEEYGYRQSSQRKYASAVSMLSPLEEQPDEDEVDESLLVNDTVAQSSPHFDEIQLNMNQATPCTPTLASAGLRWVCPWSLTFFCLLYEFIQRSNSRVRNWMS